MSALSALPTSYVLDASILVARLRPAEIAYSAVRTLLSTLVAHHLPLFIPTIALVEVAAALARGGISPEQSMATILALQDMPGLSQFPVDAALAELSQVTAAQQRLRGCDAIYVALAQQHNAVLITLDQQQQERVPPGVSALAPHQVMVPE